MPNEEAEPIKYPLRQGRIQSIQPGQKIAGVPSMLVFERMFKRISDGALIEANAYGELGGDLIQHAGMQARSLTLRGKSVEAQVVRVNSARQTLMVRFTLPTHGNDKLWGSTLERSVVLGFDDLLSPVDRFKKRAKNLWRRLRRP
jgi:hypothetical protein